MYPSSSLDMMQNSCFWIPKSYYVNFFLDTKNCTQFCLAFGIKTRRGIWR